MSSGDGRSYHDTKVLLDCVCPYGALSFSREYWVDLDTIENCALVATIEANPRITI